MSKKSSKTGAGARWLQHHALGFRMAAAQSGSRFPTETAWFKAHAEQCEKLESELKKTPTGFATKTPLYLEKLNPRGSSTGQEIAAYLALEAKMSRDEVCSSSLKLGVVDRTSKKLITRLLYDYDKVHTGLDGFPFHVQHGKHPGEIQPTSLTFCFEPWLDEPRLPSVPLDFFLLLQIVHEQFNMPKLTKNLQGAEWSGVLLSSGKLLAKSWCAAIAGHASEDFLAGARATLWADLS